MDHRKSSPETVYELKKAALRLRRQGRSVKEIVEATGLADQTVRDAFYAYDSGGIDAIKPKRRGRKPGEKRRLSPEQEQEVIKLLVDHTPEQLQFECCLWPDAVAITEGNTATATGNALDNDSYGEIGDTGAFVWNDGPETALYGTVTLNDDGSYSYALNNANAAVRALAAGETLTETFRYTITDAGGNASASALTVTIEGVGATDGISVNGHVTVNTTFTLPWNGRTVTLVGAANIKRRFGCPAMSCPRARAIRSTRS